jgi:hypothetical protein
MILPEASSAIPGEGKFCGSTGIICKSGRTSCECLTTPAGDFADAKIFDIGYVDISIICCHTSRALN